MKKSLIILLTFACGAASGQPFSFLAPVPLTTQKAPLSAATDDFNNDGNPDVAVANAGSQTISLFLGKGDGTFQAPASYPVPPGCAVNYLTVADFNKDRHADLLATCLMGNLLVLLPGKGDGTFGSAISSPLPLPAFAGDVVEGGNLSPAGADFDGDGNPDVVLSLAVLDSSGNLSTTNAYMLRGRGDGTFQTPQPVAVFASMQTLSFAAADFNGDGKADLATLVYDSVNSAITLLVVLGQGDGTFRVANSYPITVGFDVTATDINGDGKTDLVISGGQISATPAGSVAIFTGKGDGSFHLTGNYTNASPGFISGICLADMQGSGKLDIVEALWSNLTDNSQASGSIVILPGNGDGTFQNPETFASSGQLLPAAVISADFNRDGRPDLVFPTLLNTSLSGLASGSGVGSLSSQLAAGLAMLPAGSAEVLLNTTPPLTFSDANAASFQRGAMAQDSIIAAFGKGLASTTATAKTLSTSLGGVTVSVKDSAGVTRPATLFYVSPTQINYALPPGTATGEASVTIANGSSTVTAAQPIVAVVPGVFAVNGIAAANVATYVNGALAAFGNAFQVSAGGAITPAPIDLGSGSQQVYLLLYGTGIRHARSVTANVGSLTGLPVGYAGPQGFYVGEDQVNVLLPPSLKGAGLIDLTLVADGQTSNQVKLEIR